MNLKAVRNALPHDTSWGAGGDVGEGARGGRGGSWSRGRRREAWEAERQRSRWVWAGKAAVCRGGEDGWLSISGGAKVGAGENEGRQACGMGV